MLKVSHLKGEKAKLSKKLIGIKFNMEYLKLATLEVQDSVISVECKLQALNHKMKLLEHKVHGFRVLGLHLSLNVQVSFCLLDGELHGSVEGLWLMFPSHL
jgi:hypothetical protein